MKHATCCHCKTDQVLDFKKAQNTKEIHKQDNGEPMFESYWFRCRKCGGTFRILRKE